MPSGMDLGGSLLVSCDRPSNNNKNKPIQMIDSQANHYITSYITHSSWLLPLFLIRKLYKFFKEWNWSLSFVSIKNNPSSPFSFLYLKHHTYNEGGKGFFRDPWKAFFPVNYQMAIFFLVKRDLVTYPSTVDWPFFTSTAKWPLFFSREMRL